MSLEFFLSDDDGGIRDLREPEANERWGNVDNIFVVVVDYIL